ncbi:hypothetical protein QTP88_004996 [Uroleucon formosanum]
MYYYRTVQLTRAFRCERSNFDHSDEPNIFFSSFLCVFSSFGGWPTNIQHPSHPFSTTV